MAISVDWSSWPYLITIPQSDLTLVSGTRYSITVDFLWELLRDFSDSSEGIGAPITYRRIPSTASTPAITEFNDPAYAAEFEDGAYLVDILNGNTNFRDVEVKNQVSVGTNNTTGFIDPQFLELSLFAGSVCIDSLNATGIAVAGTGTTASGAIIGTRQAPCNNAADALTIANARGINTFNLMSNLTLNAGDYSSGYSWTADRREIQLDVDAAVLMTGNSAFSMTIVGAFDGGNNIEKCDVKALESVSGNLFQCNMISTMVLSGDTKMDQCFSGVTGLGYPAVTVGTYDFEVRDMRGSLGLVGVAGGTHSIGVYGGRIVLEASCVAGTVHARGDPYEISDSSAGTTVVNQTGIAANTTSVWASNKALTVQKWLGLR